MVSIISSGAAGVSPGKSTERLGAKEELERDPTRPAYGTTVAIGICQVHSVMRPSEADLIGFMFCTPTANRKALGVCGGGV